jgi:hypothetical protein
VLVPVVLVVDFQVGVGVGVRCLWASEKSITSTITSTIGEERDQKLENVFRETGGKPGRVRDLFVPQDRS